MKITLYKNCIFTRSYSEVCDCRIKDSNGKTARDRYLEGLTKEVFELDSVYSTNSGTINVPIQFPNSTDSVYDFNYLKIEFESITRYCFIDDIQFMNYIAVIYYSEDIWHSYSDSMTFRKGFLKNALLQVYGKREDIVLSSLFCPCEFYAKDVYKLPEPYTTFVIIAQLQTYKLSADVTSERETYAVILGRNSQNTVTAEQNWYYNSFSEAERVAKAWVKQAGIASLANGTYYEIDNFTIVPYIYISQLGALSFINTNKVVFFMENVNIDDTILEYLAACQLKSGTTKIYFNMVQGGVYNRVGIGTMNATYETIETNLSYEYQLYLYIDSTDVKLLLNLQGKVIDITDNFIFEVPFSAITGDITAQRKLARSMETVNGVRQIVGGVAKIATSVVSGSAGISLGKTEQFLAEHTASGNVRRRYTVRDATRLAEGLYREKQSTSESAGGIVGGVDSVVSGIQGIISANTPIYMSQKGTFVQGNKGMSCQYGIFQKVPVSDNEEIVKGIINEIGYETSQIVDENILIPKITDRIYNILRFGSVILYGDFPQSVCETLKKILINGIKIWYDESKI